MPPADDSPLSPISPFILISDVMSLISRKGYRVSWDGNGQAITAIAELLGSLDIAAPATAHEDDLHAPAYCACGELTRQCPDRPREWRTSVSA